MPRRSRDGQYPVVAASTVTHRRSLRLGERFAITSRVVGWDERVVYLEQVFTRRDDLIARGIVAGRFLTRAGGRVAAPDVARLLDGTATSPALPPDVTGWATALDVAHRNPE